MQDYPRFHQNRTNLLLHILMVPLFVAGVLFALWSAVRGAWLVGLLALTAPIISIAVQGAGHKQEPNPPLPFDGFGDFVVRIFSEQFYKFPKFVLSGEWLRAVRSSR
jgi:hypothetical protein